MEALKSSQGSGGQPQDEEISRLKREVSFLCTLCGRVCRRMAVCVDVYMYYIHFVDRRVNGLIIVCHLYAPLISTTMPCCVLCVNVHVYIMYIHILIM